MKKRTFIACFSSLLILGSIVGCEQTNTSSSTSSQTTTSETQTTTSSSLEQDTSKYNGKILFVSPSGAAINDGLSMESPTSLIQAIANADAGDRIILLDGEYSLRTSVTINDTLGHKHGTKEHPILIRSYSNDPSKVVLNFSRQSFNTSLRGVTLNNDYWEMKFVTVKGAGDNGIYIGGNHNLVEGCITKECRDTGLQLGRKGSAYLEINDWPSYNTILNCTSFNNSDPKGEDADGFACKLTTGIGNVFDGCIAYNNIDDGWDLYAKTDSGAIGAVTIRNCVAFNNGARTDGFGSPNSDGNGFKLGGERVANQHIVENCVAFNNMAHGFTDNSNPGMIYIKNCTSFDNGTRDRDANNFDMARDANSNNTYSNLLSYCEKYSSKDQFKGNVEHSVFYYGYTTIKFGEKQYAYSEDVNNRGERFESDLSPFVSTIAPDCNSDIHSLLRNEDGTVNLGDFLRVNPNSEYATMGINGTALGANLHSMKEAK